MEKMIRINDMVEVSEVASIEKKERIAMVKPTELVKRLSDGIMYGSADRLNDDFRHIPQEIEILDYESQVTYWEELVCGAEEMLQVLETKGLKARKLLECYDWMVYKTATDPTFTMYCEGRIDPYNNYEDSREYFEGSYRALRKEYSWRKKNFLFNKSQLDLAKERLDRLFHDDEDDVKVRLPKSNTIHWSMTEWMNDSFLIRLRNGIDGLDDVSIWRLMAEVQSKRNRKEMTFKAFLEAMGLLYGKAYNLTSDISYAQKRDKLREVWKNTILKSKDNVASASKDVCICTDKCWYDANGKATTNPDKVVWGYSEINFVPQEAKMDAYQNISYDSFTGSMGYKFTDMEALVDEISAEFRYVA